MILPTTLTKDLKNKIDQLITEKPDIEKSEIAEKLNIPLDVLKELYIRERQEELLKKAEQTSRELLSIDLEQEGIERKFGKAKLQLIKMKQAESQFLRETLGKDDGYSKRSELTGKNGDAIQIKEILFHAPVPNLPQQTQPNE